MIDLGTTHRVLSSAPYRGGGVNARSILNHQVAGDPIIRQPGPRGRSRMRAVGSDPARYLDTLASDLKAKPPAVGLMTAVPMTQMVNRRESSSGVWVECFCTVGVTNAVKAGERASHPDQGPRGRSAGTINIILVTNANLTVSAMVGAVQVATESKTAVLLERRIRSRTGRRWATGTGTDTVVVACRLRGVPQLRYSGTHTVIGAMIGRVVGRCVQTGLARAARWQSQRLKSERG